MEPHLDLEEAGFAIPSGEWESRVAQVEELMSSKDGPADHSLVQV